MTVVYSPIDGIRVNEKGVLVESSRTNSILQSQSLATSPWGVAHVTVADPTVTNNTVDVLAPDGTQTATKVILPAVAAGEMSSIQQTFTATATAWSASIWLRTATGTATVFLHLITGATIKTVQCNVTSDWTRISLNAQTLTAATWIYELGVDCVNGDAEQPAQTVYAWGAQCELGAFASSYIYTVAGTQNRPADMVSVVNPLCNCDDTWMIGGTFTPYVGSAWSAVSSSTMLWGVNVGTGANTAYFYLNGTNLAFTVRDVSNNAKTIAATFSWTTGQITKQIFASNTRGLLEIWVEGVSVGSVSGTGTGIISTWPSAIAIGRTGTGSHFNGYVRDFKIARHADIARL